MTLDYYDEARRLARILEQEGLGVHAEAIMEVLEAGATATEILMGLRYHMERARMEASQTTARQLKQLSDEIQRALA